MKFPDEWTPLYFPDGTVGFYKLEFYSLERKHRMTVTVICHVLQTRRSKVPMATLKDDDSTITWDASAMERDTK